MAFRGKKLGRQGNEGEKVDEPEHLIYHLITMRGREGGQ
jgi:hypothetical protein